MNKSNFTITQMTLSDLNSIKDTLIEDFDDFWNYNIFKSELNNKNSIYFVLKESNKIIGFIGMLIVLDEADITNIVIKKEYRKKGLSKKLLEHIISECKKKKITKINLEVSSNNIPAINLYNLFGFQIVGLRKKYYDNSDAILFTKFL